MLKSLKHLGLILCLSLIMPANHISAAGEQPATASASPPIAQHLVREGEFAVKLQKALGVGTSEDEVEAESTLGNIGITPKNGWIADYPLTPDILGEIRASVITATENGKLKLERDEAIKRLEAVAAETGLSVKPHTADSSHKPASREAVQYPDQTVINNYYINDGPPVVTYYRPPEAYIYLYGWVPYPFWWAGFWFPGYFILNDFHRPYHYRHHTVFISNHFNHPVAHRVLRIDPVQRYSGRTYAGIGAPSKRGYISTGVPRSEKRIFNAPRYRSRTDTPASAPVKIRRQSGSQERLNLEAPGSRSRDDFRGGGRGGGSRGRMDDGRR